MVLEKIIKFTKIATTNRGLYAVPLVFGVGIAGALADGKVDENDTVTLAFAGATLTIAAIAARKEQYAYNRIAKYCEQHGFTVSMMLDPVDRRKVKIYAEESGRLDQFENALKEYRLYSHSNRNI